MNVRAIGFAAGTVAVAAAALCLGLFLGRVPAAPEPAVVAADSVTDKAELDAAIHDYIVSHPEVLIEAQQVLEARQKEEQRVAGAKVIGESKTLLLDAAYDGVVGNPNGKRTVVEFFDYNCPYCKHALPDMEEMVKADPELRFVLKELPILGPDSQKAHVVSMAFRKLMPEKYGEFHRHLLGDPGRSGEEKAVKIAVQLGADEAALRQAMQDPAIAKAFAETYDLANRLSITGTPSYVIGDEVVFGALGRDVLEEKVEQIGAM